MATNEPMSLDEAIVHAKEIAADNCTECGREHQQLAEWLTELRELRKIKDTRPLTPEILTAAGWRKVDDTPYHVCWSLDFDEDLGNVTDYAAFMMVTFGKLREIVKLEIERTFGDCIRSLFRRKITVGEFNTLLDIVGLTKFKINGELV